MNDMRSLASQLNQDCACYSLDMDKLRQSLRVDSVLSAWWPHWQSTHAHLFSGTGLFVSQHQLQTMQEAVRVLHQVMVSPAWRAHARAQAPEVARTERGPLGVFMGYDFHLTADGPKLIEINTNAGGGLLNAYLLAAHGRADAGAAVRAAFVEMFR